MRLEPPLSVLGEYASLESPIQFILRQRKELAALRLPKGFPQAGVGTNNPRHEPAPFGENH
jgi:hypothetical protein